MADHAVVIGGSIAGLISARVLSDYFDKVTVLERDQRRPSGNSQVRSTGQPISRAVAGWTARAGVAIWDLPRSSEISVLCGSPWAEISSGTFPTAKPNKVSSFKIGARNRGAMVCRAARGNARSHICAYHQG